MTADFIVSAVALVLQRLLFSVVSLDSKRIQNCLSLIDTLIWGAVRERITALNGMWSRVCRTFLSLSKISGEYSATELYLRTEETRKAILVPELRVGSSLHIC